MANVASPYGLRPVNLIGGQSFNGGVIREFRMTSNTATGIFFGDLVKIASGQPTAVVTGDSPVAMNLATTAGNATSGAPRGVVGVCVGVRYVDPVLKYEVFAQYLPANAVTNGYTNIRVRVMDDPDALFVAQAATAIGTFSGGIFASIGRNVPLSFSTAGSTATGNSGLALDTGSNWANVAVTSTLALRIVDIVAETSTDTYADVIVKLNTGFHAYQNPVGA